MRKEQDRPDGPGTPLIGTQGAHEAGKGGLIGHPGIWRTFERKRRFCRMGGGGAKSGHAIATDFSDGGAEAFGYFAGAA